MANTKHVTVDQTQQIMTAFATKADERFLKQADVTQYTIKKQGTAEAGYSATYQLYTVGTGEAGADEAVGAKINIPKDMVVESGSVVDITFNTSDSKLYDGAVDVTEIIKGEGGTATAADAGKYIKLIVANADEDKIYIKATDLVDIYTAGDGIDITGNEVSVVVDSSNARGLSVGASGLALAAAVPSVSGVGGSDGAMTAADKEKLDNADVTAYTAGNGVDITNHVVSANVDAGNGLSNSASGIAMATVTASTSGEGGSNGAMLATDKEKLDNADVTAYTAGNGVAISDHAVSAVVDGSNANGLAVGASGISLGTAVPATSYVAATGTYVSGTTYYTDATGAATVDTTDFEPGVTDVSSYFVAQSNTAANGAMTAADKAKLDGLGTASAADITAIINSIWAE